MEQIQKKTVEDFLKGEPIPLEVLTKDYLSFYLEETKNLKKEERERFMEKKENDKIGK